MIQKRDKEERVEIGSSNNDDNNDDCCHILFQKVNSIIPLLMYSTTKKTVVTTEEIVLKKLQWQQKLCKALHQEISSFSRQKRNCEIKRNKKKMTEYLMLPLTMIIQSFYSYYQNNNNNFSVIVSSAINQCIEIISKTMTVWFSFLVENHHKYRNNYQDDVYEKCIQMCFLAWSLLHTSASSTSNKINRLDKGEDAQQALLNTIQSILIYESKNGSLVQKLSSGETHNWMVTTITSQCVTVLEETLPTHHHRVKININSTESNPKRPKINVPLQLQALETLLALLTTTTRSTFSQAKTVTLWRSIFPGTFACLYRLALQHLAITIPSNKNILSRTLHALSLLLNITLRKKSTTQQNNYSKKNHAIQDLKYALSSLIIDTSTNQHDCTTLTKNLESKSVCCTDSDDKKQVSKAASILLSTLSSSDISISRDVTEEVKKQNCSINVTITEEEEHLFKKEVTKRIPTPLIVLFQLLPSSIQKISTSENVILASTQLCESILIHCRLFLSIENNYTINENREATMIKLNESALDCLLITYQQENKRVSQMACAVLRQYRSDSDNITHEIGWNRDKNLFVLPKLLELITSLPILAQSGRETELISKMNLFSGYLCLFQHWEEGEHIDDKVRLGQKKKISTKQNEHFLSMTHTTENTIRSSLSELFLLDDNAVSYSPYVNIVGVGNSSNPKSLSLSINDDNHNHFSYLRSGKVILETKRMMNSLFSALGPRQTALFIDACIADLYEALLDYQQDKNKCKTIDGRCLGSYFRVDKQFSDWLQPKLGLIAVSHKLMVCLMNKVKTLSSSSVGNNSRREITRLKKIFKSLAKAIIPILLSDHLFNLPTSLVLARIYDINNVPKTEDCQFDPFHGDDKHKIRGENKSSGSQFVSYDREGQISATTLNRNALMVSYVLKIIGVLSTGLVEDINPFLSVLLYPILQKTSDCNHHYVQQSAFLVLRQLSYSSTGDSEIFALVSSKFDHLIETISLDLLYPGEYLSQAWFQQLVSIQSLHKLIDFLFVRQNHQKPVTNWDGGSVSHVRLIKIMGLINSTIKWFDKSFDKGFTDILENKTMLHGLLKFFSVVGLRVNQSLKPTLELLKNSHSEIPRCECKKESKRINLLSPFCKNTYPVINFDDPSSAKEVTNCCGFNESRKRNNFKEKKVIISCHHLKTISSTLKKILCLSSFFLSSKHLQIQKVCCEVFVNVFECLATIQNISNIQNVGYEGEDVLGNPLLESIHQFWPSLFCMMRDSTAILVEFPSRQSYSTPQKTDVPMFHVELLLSSLMQIVSTMSLSAGDFVAGRIENAWPTISNIMHHCLKQKMKHIDLLKERHYFGSHLSLAHENLCNGEKGNDQLLASMLSCLENIYSSSIELGMSLSHLIPVAGIIILPLISDGGQIGEAALRSLKAMLNIDCDSLWTALLTTSCIGLSQRPLFGLPDCEVAEFSLSQTHDSLSLRKNALILVNYVRNLPESNL